MAAARNVGRVGALAVALGVGFAMTTTTCPAWAESGPAAGSSTGSADAPTHSAPAKGATSDTNGTGKGKPERPNKTGSKSAAAPAVTASVAAATAPAAAPKHAGTTPSKPSGSTLNPLTAVTPPSSVADIKPVASKAISTPGPVAATSLSTVGSVTHPLAGVVTNQVAVAPPTPTNAPSVQAFMALPATILTTAVEMVKAVLTSFTPRAPGSPPNPPLMWALLAVVRREFFNAPVDVKYTVSTPDSMGKVTISLAQTDVGGNQLNYTATDGTKGTVAPNADGHSFTYTPAAGQVGTDTVTITATDPSASHINGFAGLLNALSFGLLGDAGRTATADVQVTLNTPPQFSSLSSDTDGDGIVTGTVKFTDSDLDTLTYSGSATTLKGSVAITPGGGFTYTPTADERNVAALIGTTDTDQFTVTVNDGHGGTGTTNVSVTILPAVIASNPTPADVASDPETALATAQSVIAADTAAYTSVQASMSRSIVAYNIYVDPADLLNSLNQIKADAQTSLTAALAQQQAGVSGTGLPDPRTYLESRIGPMTSDQLTTLLAQQQANINAQQALLQSLNTAANAKAVIAAKTATAPVFNRIEYTVGAGGSLTGQVYFVDPQGESMSIYGVGDTITPYFDQSGSGKFSLPAPSSADYTPTFSMYVDATDTSGNHTRTQVTMDRSMPSAPPAATPPTQILAAYSGLFEGISGAVSSYNANIDQAEAQRREAEAAQNQALIESLDDYIAQSQAVLANVLNNFQAAQNNLSAGYLAGAINNV